MGVCVEGTLFICCVVIAYCSDKHLMTQRRSIVNGVCV